MAQTEGLLEIAGQDTPVNGLGTAPLRECPLATGTVVQRESTHTGAVIQISNEFLHSIGTVVQRGCLLAVGTVVQRGYPRTTAETPPSGPGDVPTDRTITVARRAVSAGVGRILSLKEKKAVIFIFVNRSASGKHIFVIDMCL